MAKSPAHRFGQMVGDMLEDILRPIMQQIADDHSLFLDQKGARPGVRSGKKLSWEDRFGNTHDLDFVLEKDGDPRSQGTPVAFVEAAWRRYTKHSKNKAQEIQGAVLPIAERFGWEPPFLGAFLAGEFTAPSLEQLRSHGFTVAHLPYESIVRAFSIVGIDARFDEDTPTDDFQNCVDEISSLSESDWKLIEGSLVTSNREQISEFVAALREKIDRLVETVSLMPLFGDSKKFQACAEAVEYLKEFDVKIACGRFQKWEVAVRYTNGDEVRGTFDKSSRAIVFLQRFI